MVVRGGGSGEGARQNSLAFKGKMWRSVRWEFVQTLDTSGDTLYGVGVLD